jgi:hypothetical protein
MPKAILFVCQSCLTPPRKDPNINLLMAIMKCLCKRIATPEMATLKLEVSLAH